MFTDYQILPVVVWKTSWPLKFKGRRTRTRRVRVRSNFISKYRQQFLPGNMMAFINLFGYSHAIGKQSFQVYPGHIAGPASHHCGNQGDSVFLIRTDITETGRGRIPAFNPGRMRNIIRGFGIKDLPFQVQDQFITFFSCRQGISQTGNNFAEQCQRQSIPCCCYQIPGGCIRALPKKWIRPSPRESRI